MFSLLLSGIRSLWDKDVPGITLIVVVQRSSIVQAEYSY